MKIWFDIVTPKDLKFFKPMVEKLSKKHTVLCTARDYKEITVLAKVHKFKMVIVGRYGGGTKEGKLKAAIERMSLLTKKITVFSPDLLISFCSPDACRVAFGLGIKQIGFNDGPHGTIPHKLSIPLLDKLLIPNAGTKESFEIYGINKRDIIRYNAIDAAYTINYKTIKTKLPFVKSKKNILVRMPEDFATYMPEKNNCFATIKKIITTFRSENIVIIARYKEQFKQFSKLNGNFQVIDMKYDGKSLLENCDVFVGTGGTMTAEACMLGTPCATMGNFSNIIYDFLIKSKLLKKEPTPDATIKTIKKLLNTSKSENKKRAKIMINKMEDPYDVLIKTMRTL